MAASLRPVRREPAGSYVDDLVRLPLVGESNL